MTRNALKTNSALRVARLAADPASPENGLLYYNTGLNKFKVYENSAWDSLASEAYANALAAGFDPKQSVRAATTAALPAVTYTPASTKAFVPGDVTTGTEVITITAHGFVDGDQVYVSTDTTLPAPLAASTLYYIISATANTFQLSLTSGGSAIDLTTQGTGNHSVFTAGFGAKLVANSNGAIPAQDGVTLTAGQRILVWNQAAQLQNGIYTLTTVGSGGAPFVLTRATDFDGSPTNEVDGGEYVYIQGGGTIYGGTNFVVTGPAGVAASLGVTAIIWSQISGAATLQSAYEASQTITVTDAQGTIAVSNAETANTLTVTHTGTAGTSLGVVGGGAANASPAVTISNSGTTNALTVSSTGAGKVVTVTSTSTNPAANLLALTSAATATAPQILVNPNGSSAPVISTVAETSDGLGIQTGECTSANNSGALNFSTGSVATGTSGSVGVVSGGAAGAAGVSGSVTITSGNSGDAASGDSGTLVLSSGTSLGSNSGVVTISSGNAGITAGDISVTGGNGTGTNSSGANINVSGGNGLGTGAAGSVSISAQGTGTTPGGILLSGKSSVTQQSQGYIELTSNAGGPTNTLLWTEAGAVERQLASVAVVSDYAPGTQTLTDNVSDTVVTAFSFALATYYGCTVNYSIREATSLKTRTGSLMIAHDGTNTSITDNYAETADIGVTWSSDISGGNVRLKYTTTSTGNNRVMKSDIKKFYI